MKAEGYKLPEFPRVIKTYPNNKSHVGGISYYFERGNCVVNTFWCYYDTIQFE